MCHQKHTSGGDFRQAALRAVRQGLMRTQSVLLEPFFAFEILTPPDHLSRILYQLDVRKAEVSVDSLESGSSRIQGRGPVRTLMNFQEELARLSRGTASFSYESDGYDICREAEAIIAQSGYQEAADRLHPSASVFCEAGTSILVPWDEVEDHLHIPTDNRTSYTSMSVNSGRVSDEEMKRAFANAGGSNQSAKKSAPTRKKKTELSLEPTRMKNFSHLPVCLIVDGYNMIYAWPELKALASHSLFQAREELISLLVNYQGYKGWSMIIVFDGTKQKGNSGSSSRNGSSSIVYTPAGMSADSYIEKKVHDLRGKFQCIAATSDALIQNSVFSHGARRISARELEAAVRSVNQKAFQDLKDFQTR